MRKASILAAALLLSPAVAQAKSLEELLVEKGVITRGEAAGATSSSPAKVYYNEGTRIDFPDSGFTLKIRTMLQARYSFIDNDEQAAANPNFDPNASFNGVNGTRVNNSGVDVARARIVVEGTALYQEFAYKLEGDFVGTGNDSNLVRDTTSNRKEPNLKDAYVQWQPCEGWGTRIGQFRTFVSRQFRTNEANLQFADRSVTSTYNYLGWQQGIAQFGSTDDGMVEGGIGLFNGLSDGEDFGPSRYRSGNGYSQDTNHTIMGTLRFNPIGKMDAMVEGDVDYTEDPALSFGAVYSYSEAHGDVGRGVQEDFDQDNVSADANFKYAGVSIHSEYFYRQASMQHRDAGLDFSTNGGYVQAGVFLEPRTLEFAARYSIQDCDDGKATGICTNRDKIQEAAATVNYYWWKHALKAQLGYTFVNEDYATGSRGVRGSSEANSNRWIFQLSSYF